MGFKVYILAVLPVPPVVLRLVSLIISSQVLWEDAIGQLSVEMDFSLSTFTAGSTVSFTLNHKNTKMQRANIEQKKMKIT
jgi:hypothetical protein